MCLPLATANGEVEKHRECFKIKFSVHFKMPMSFFIAETCHAHNNTKNKTKTTFEESGRATWIYEYSAAEYFLMLC